jgi:hypothetical protein
MTDRPLNLTAPDVQALLGGRKTQHRVVLETPPPKMFAGVPVDAVTVFPIEGSVHFTCGDFGYKIPTPHAIGDRLRVRETFTLTQLGFPVYRADACDQTGARWSSITPGDPENEVLWKPSTHMRREFSRLTLFVTDVRVQWLQEISEADAIAEGARPFFDKADVEMMASASGGYIPMMPLKGPTDAYQKAWDARHKPAHQWTENPWVCALTFDVVKRNIDEVK